MSATWSLSLASDHRPLSAWGIDSAVLIRRNLAEDEFSFSLAPADLTAAQPFAYGDTIVLWRSGVRYFTGTITQQPAYGATGEQRQRYVARNAWWQLERLIYQQPYMTYIMIGSTRFPRGSWSTHVVLGQDSWGNKITVNQVITKIGAFALSRGAGLFTVAALPTLWAPPITELRDMSCAEAIRRMVAWAPDCVGWFDYSTEVPEFNLQQRSALTTESIALGEGSPLIRLENLTPRPDLQPAGVVFTYRRTETDEENGTIVEEQRQAAGTLGVPGTIYATIDLAPGEALPRESGAVLWGLAGHYYTALSTLHYSGTLVLKEQQCTGLLRPGKRVNLTGGRAEWATMAAVVQTTSENLMIGETTVELGPPEHLGITDFVGLMRHHRNRHKPSGFSETQHNGTEGIPAPDPEDYEDEDVLEPATPEEPGLGGDFGGDPAVDPGERTPNPDAGAPRLTYEIKQGFKFTEVEFCDEGTETTLHVLHL